MDCRASTRLEENWTGELLFQPSGVSMRWDILGGLSAGLNDGRPDEQAIALVRRASGSLSARNGCGYGIPSESHYLVNMCLESPDASGLELPAPMIANGRCESRQSIRDEKGGCEMPQFTRSSDTSVTWAVAIFFLTYT